MRATIAPELVHLGAAGIARPTLHFQAQHALSADCHLIGAEVLLRPLNEARIRRDARLTAALALEARRLVRDIDLTIAVNMEPHHVRDEQALFHLAAAVRTAGRCVVEVTEHGPVPSCRELSRLRGCGVSVSLDDVTPARFLRALHAAPDEIKLELPMWGRELPQAIRTCRTLGIRVVVERIESHSDLEFVRRAGAHAGQGFHWSPPLPHQDFAEYASTQPRGHGAASHEG